MKIVRQVVFFSLVLILGMGLIGAGCGKRIKKDNSVKNDKTSSSTQSNSNPDEIPTVGSDVMKEWKTYQDEKLGIEVQYPAGLKVVTHSDVPIINEKRELLAKSTGAALTFDLHGYENTNLRQAIISGNYATASERDCLKPYNDLKGNKNASTKVSTEVHDGITWYKFEGMDAAAGNHHRTIMYAVPHNNICFTGGLLLHSVERMNYDEAKRPVEYDPAPFLDTFEKMIARVRFIK